LTNPVDVLAAAIAVGPADLPVEIRIPLPSADDLFGDPNLVNFIGLMRLVVNNTQALQELRDTTLRGTDGMEPSLQQARIDVMRLAEAVVLKRIEIELNNALPWLEAYYNKQSK